jgi:hypothetical protein
MQSEILADVVDEAKRISRSVPSAKWYGFGSFFSGSSTFEDIDILVVCTSDQGRRHKATDNRDSDPLAGRPLDNDAG